MAERNGVDDGFRGRAVDVEPGRAAREDRLEVRLGHGARRAVEDLAVVLHDRGDVERRLHAPLDLERRDAGLDKLPHVRAEAQVLHRERQAPFARLRVGVGLPAAVGAFAAVARAVLLHRAEEAEPGDRVAERAVDEALELQAAAPLRDRRDLRGAQFAGEHDPREAELLQREHAFEVVRDELGRRVQLEVREIRAAEPRDAEVLHDERRGTHRVERGKLAERLGDVRLVDDRVERDVDLPALRPREAHQAPEVRKREVGRVGARGELGESAVDRVRARGERGARSVEVPGRG